MSIHVCSLNLLDATVKATGASKIVTLINVGTPVLRPKSVSESDHLFIGMNDIVEIVDPALGHILPGEDHLDQLLAFVRAWDRKAPLVVHCFAGVSRSTAAAYTAALALDPSRDEDELAQLLRQRSPTATPNARIIALADQKLGRQGRMIAAINRIGRGSDCFEGVPFALPVPLG
jgi:predicted protein tyrosine phosphatase